MLSLPDPEVPASGIQDVISQEFVQAALTSRHSGLISTSTHPILCQGLRRHLRSAPTAPPALYSEAAILRGACPNKIASKRGRQQKSLPAMGRHESLGSLPIQKPAFYNVFLGLTKKKTIFSLTLFTSILMWDATAVWSQEVLPVCGRIFEALHGHSPDFGTLVPLNRLCICDRRHCICQ
jgi:hypothetical protein